MSDHLQDARQPFVRIDFGIMDRVPEFGPLALTVYAVLAMHANNDTGRCFPGRRAIAREAKMSERAVDGAIKALVAAGCISVTPRTTKTATGATVKTSNIYSLLTVSRKVGQDMPGGGAGGAPGVGQVVPQGGAGGAHRTSLNELAERELLKDIAPHVTARPLPSASESVTKPVKAKAPPAPRAPKPMYDAFKAAFPTAQPWEAQTFDTAATAEGLTVERWHAFMALPESRQDYPRYLTRKNATDRFIGWSRSTRRDPTREAGDNGASLAARNEAFLKAKGWA